MINNYNDNIQCTDSNLPKEIQNINAQLFDLENDLYLLKKERIELVRKLQCNYNHDIVKELPSGPRDNNRFDKYCKNCRIIFD